MSDTPQNVRKTIIDTDGNVTVVEEPWTPEEWEKLSTAEQYWMDHGWKKERQKAYPSIGDQLDALYHAGVFPQEMQDKIAKVKAEIPKPE